MTITTMLVVNSWPLIGQEDGSPGRDGQTARFPAIKRHRAAITDPYPQLHVQRPPPTNRDRSERVNLPRVRPSHPAALQDYSVRRYQRRPPNLLIRSRVPDVRRFRSDLITQVKVRSQSGWSVQVRSVITSL